MADGIADRFKSAWNAFLNVKEPDEFNYTGYTPTAYSSIPDRPTYRLGNEKSIVSAIYTRIAIDAAASVFKHVRLDDQERYSDTINSGLNDCLNVQANIDQTPRAFRQDIVFSLLTLGVIAIVPVDTTIDPTKSDGFDVRSMRVGEIVQWYPSKVKLRLYNDRKGEREEVTLSKSKVAIVVNPLYAVMNEQNSTLQRLIRKLSILDAIDEQAGSGKLDLIIQLPYVIKTEARKQQADNRRKDIEMQLKGSKYGIAYTDGTEKITQLNRPVENNLLKQIEFLTTMLYSQLGLTPEVFTGQGDEKQMLNYNNRTIQPILVSIVEAMRATFLSRTARTQKQSIMSFQEPFAQVPVGDLAEIADKFTRNEIMTSNEFRAVIGMRPSTDPNADELRNKNLNPRSEETNQNGIQPEPE